MVQQVPITLLFDDFQGGRFYSGRYVHQIVVSTPVKGIEWWTDRLSYEASSALKAFAKMAGREQRHMRGDRRHRRACFSYTIDEGATEKLFGITSMQFFNRRLRDQKIVACDRSRGWWYCESSLLPLVRIPRSERHVVGKVPADYRELFAPLLVDWETWTPEYKPNYDGLDVGPTRKPPVWVCNRCGRTAEVGGWDWRDEFHHRVDGPRYGAIFIHISHCPACGAKQDSNPFKQVEAAITKPPERFRPTMRMQDDLYFTL